MIKAVIFDLDNCLAAAKEVGEELFAPAFEAIRNANNGKVSEEDLKKAFDECWRKPLDVVAKNHGFSDEMLSAGWDVFAKTEVKKPMAGYGDLAELEALPMQRFLVTSGFRRLQESKIAALDLERYFTEVFVDAIDERDRKRKQGVFELILEKYHLAPAEVLVVGDSPDSEIEAGTRLGIPTVQTLRAEVPRSDKANFHVESLGELRELLSRLNRDDGQ